MGMPWTANVLVVANRTAGSRELLDAMRVRAAKGPTHFTLLIPRARSAPDAGTADPLAAVLERMRDAGLDVESVIADADPVLAVSETFDPLRHDEIIVGTLPVGASKWLQIDLPHRLARLTSVAVTHVVAPQPPARRANLA